MSALEPAVQANVPHLLHAVLDEQRRSEQRQLAALAQHAADVARQQARMRRTLSWCGAAFFVGTALITLAQSWRTLAWLVAGLG